MFAGVCKFLSKEDTLQTHHYIRQFLQQYSVVRFVGKGSLAVLFGLLFLGMTLSTNVLGVHAQALVRCSAGESAYSVVSGDTLGGIAARYGISWTKLAAQNHIANPNLIYKNQTICIPAYGVGNTSSTHAPLPLPAPAVTTAGAAVSISASRNTATGSSNVFPYPACTWWADQRYEQLHGYYVPWTTNADAWAWTARAYEFGWHVSSAPTVGAIMDLQPGVQGAYYLGHVAVVEQVLSNGRVIASSTSWGANPYAVTDWEFTPGPGVTFITA